MPDAAARVTSGDGVVYLPAGDDARLAFADGAALVVFDIRTDKLFDAFARPLPAAFDTLPSAWVDHVVAPADVPGDLVARARAVHAAVAPLVAALAPDRWLPLGDDFIARDDVLGTIRVFGSGFARIRTHFADELYARLWADSPARVHLVAPPPALAPIASSFVASLRTRLLQLDAGTHAFRYGDPIAAFDGRYVTVDLDALPNVLFNPFARLLTRARVIELLSDRVDHPDDIVPLAPALHAAFPAIRVALQQTRAQIVDRYVAEIRAGTRTISGGPTTDQSWTVRSHDGATFTISGYTDAGPTEDPLSEARLREMLSTMAMFGLADLPA